MSKIKLIPVEDGKKIITKGSMVIVIKEYVLFDIFAEEPISFVVKAKAKCSPEDTFNKETGIRIAESRAHMKALDKASKYVEGVLSKLSLITSDLKQDYNKFSSAFNKEVSHIKELTK